MKLLAEEAAAKLKREQEEAERYAKENAQKLKVNALFGSEPVGATDKAVNIWNKTHEKLQKTTVQLIQEESKKEGFELQDNIENLQFIEGMSCKIGSLSGKYTGTYKLQGQEKLMHGFGRFVGYDGFGYVIYESQFQNNELH